MIRSFDTIEDKDDDGYDIIRFPIETMYLRKGNVLSKTALADKLLTSFGISGVYTLNSDPNVFIAIPLGEFDLPAKTTLKINDRLYGLIEL